MLTTRLLSLRTNPVAHALEVPALRKLREGQGTHFVVASADQKPRATRRPEFKIRKGLRQQLLQLLTKRAHLVEPVRVLQVAKDPDDNKFMECADAARADYLITGNAKHFPKFWKNTKVITSREFISIVAPHFVP